MQMKQNRTEAAFAYTSWIYKQNVKTTYNYTSYTFGALKDEKFEKRTSYSDSAPSKTFKEPKKTTPKIFIKIDKNTKSTKIQKYKVSFFFDRKKNLDFSRVSWCV